MGQLTYSIPVTIAKMENVTIEVKDVILLLDLERKSLISGWDSIYSLKEGVYKYHRNGYGSHNVYEEDGPEVPKDIVDKYLLLTNIITYYRNKLD
ncbi:hypothetical protein D3C71_1325640 [compost metagenome]